MSGSGHTAILPGGKFGLSMYEDQYENLPQTDQPFRLLTKAEFYRLSPDERSAYARRVIGDFGMLELFKREPGSEPESEPG